MPPIHFPAAFDPIPLHLAFSPLLQESGWDPGRQGTGYRKLNIRWKALPALEAMRARALNYLKPMHPGLFDEWLLWYAPGDHIPMHRDPPIAEGLAHWRLNILVEIGEGGDLFLDGKRCEMEAGDALLFRPDKVLHSVGILRSGRRLVWSMGSNFPENGRD